MLYTPLNFAKNNVKYKIKEIICEPFLISRRLCQLGFVEGEEVLIKRKSALKKTLLIEICGATISLRSENASLILVGIK